MADLNANINVGIETTQALNQLKALQRQISQFHQSVAKSSGEAALAQRDLQRNFLNSVNSIQGFSAELRTVRTTAESFTNSLEKNKFSMREYFRYAAGATKTFGKNFMAEFSTIEKTAIERVKTLQTQYIKMGRDASGAMQAIAIRPTVLDMKDLGTQTAIAAQKQVLFNQLVKQGSTNLLNFGKNTQWAGRQLMVGFTLPLATLGVTAGRVFMDMEKAAIKFRKVYGDLFTPDAERQKALDGIVELGEAYTAYGVAVSDSLSMAADAAAAGFAGVDLQNQTNAALKLSVLGQLDLQKALETTISLQNAFQLSSADLAGEIDFLNAVENQTVVALDDITEAVPRVAPVIKQLGGDVRDLAFFLAAMKEGGINAAQGANALKSGLASLINPSEKAALMLSSLGINIRSIITENQGDIAGTVYNFAKALDSLDPLRRAQAIEQLFGKFQFARISALFDNITREGTQAQRVLELAGSSMQELASLSEDELAVSAASSMNKFRSAVEKIKVALVPIGEIFLEIATPFVEFGTKMLDAFNNLPDGIKKSVGTVVALLGGIGPVALMTFGLINNGIANMIKFFATVRLGYLKITGQAKGVGDETQYMTQEQLEAAAAAASLDQAHAGLTQRFTAEKAAVDQLRIAYQRAAEAGAKFALNNPQMMKPGRGTQAQGFAEGGVIRGPGTGTSDSIPALLSNGEAVIPAKQVKKYAPLIEGLIAGNLPGFAKGFLGMPKSGKATAKNREAADAIYQEFLKSSYAGVAPTEYGHQIAPTSGHSFPIFGLGGVYQKGNKRVFVKPVMDETAALAEIRGTQITRQAHGLEAPEQRIVVIRDPMDPTRQRRFLALESDLDAKFIQNEPKAIFNEEQYFRQLVASLVRVDKDLAAANVFGNVVADVGPAGVFNRASGARALTTDLPSMEEQALINLLGIKGGAKRAFAESTLSLMAGLTPQQYHQRMLGEIQRVLPALKQTVADFKLTNPAEVDAYNAMIKRLEIGLGVDWSKFHSVHSNVKVAVPKKPKAVNLANGGIVRGPGGPKDDAIPANLSNGEAVIDAETVKKNPGIIAALFQKKKIQIPGYAGNNATLFDNSKVSDEVDAETLQKRLSDTTYKVYTNAIAFQDRDLNRDAGHAPDRARVPASAFSEDISSKGGMYFAPTIIDIVDNVLGPGGDVIKELENNPKYKAFASALADRVVNELDTEFKDAKISEIALQEKTRQAAIELAPQYDVDPTAVQTTFDMPTAFLDEQSVRVQKSGMGQVSGANRGALAKGKRDYTAASFQKDAIAALDVFAQSEEEIAVAQKIKDERASKNIDLGHTGPQSKMSIPDISSSIASKGLEKSAKFNAAIDLAARGKKGLMLGKSPTGQQLPRIEIPATFTDNEIRQAREQARTQALAAQEEVGSTVKQTLEETIQEGKKALEATSPSQKAARELGLPIAQGTAQGIEDGQAEIDSALKTTLDKSMSTQASKFSGKESAFGNINTKEPAPAAGNAPRQVVQAMSQETTASRTFAGDLKASFANARANITREMGFVKEEFGSIVQQIKQKFSRGGQEIVAVAQQTNQGLVINGKEYGFNAIAQAQGRDGAIEAIVTKKNAELISKVTASYNAGARFIPGLITDGLKSGYPEIEFMGTRISDILVQKVAQGVAESPPIVGPLPGQRGFIGPLPEGMQRPKTAGEQFSKLSERASQLSFGLSALTGVLSMFGGEMAGITSTIMMLSSSLFALIQISSALATTKMGELIATKAATVAAGMGGAADVAGAVANKQVLSSVMSTLGTGGIFSKIGNAFKFILRFLGPVGIALSALAIAAPFVVNLYNDQKNKMEAFGKIVDVTADQIKFLGERAGQTVVTETGFDTATASGVDEVNTAAAKQKAEDQEFIDKFSVQIEAAKSGAVDSVESALDMLAFKLSSSGLSDQAVRETIAGIIRASKRTDITFDFANVGVSKENTDALMNSFKAQADKVANIDWNNQVGKSLSTMMQSFALQLENEEIGLDEYNNKLLELMNSVSTIENETVRGNVINTAVDSLISDEGLRNQIKSVKDLEKRFLLLQAAGGATNLTFDDLLASANKSSVSTAEFTKEIKAKTAAQRADNVVAEKAATIETTTNAAVENLKAETAAINNKIQAYKILKDAGYKTEEALSLLNDEVLVGQLVAQGGAEGVTVVVDDLLKARAELEKITGSGAGGGGGSNPIQDAIDSLKKQRQEILNTSKAYSALRRSGMDAQKAMRFAQNPELLSALNAGLKVNSKQWDEIIKRIKAAEAATNRWRKSTVEGQTEVYMETFDKVSNLFSLEEAKLQAAFDKATSADNQLIQSLENQIKGLNDQIATYSNDLDGITEKEDKINAAYDKKVRALEQTKKINEDILRQQKSQLSIADALSQGDVAAAASAMQQARSENAAAALEAQGNQLELGRQAQLAGVTSANGLTRVQIEEKISGLKKQISAIELGSLKAAQDRVTAAEQELDKNNQNLRVHGLTKKEWENQRLGIESAQARATLYAREVEKALKNAENITKQWKGLDGKTIVTTHRINTVHTSEGKLDPKDPTSAALAKLQSGAKLTKPEQKLLGLIPKAAGGFISGPGTATSDSIPALLSDGEYVVKASSVDKFGKNFLDSINAGVIPGFKKGGKVGDSQRANTEAMFQKTQADQQASFDKAQKVAKGQAAAKANVAKKGKALSEMFKALIFDPSSPEAAALSALPLGLGKVAKGLKGAKAISGLDNKKYPSSMFSIRSIPSSVRANAELGKYAPYGPLGGRSFPSTPIVTSKTERMPIEQLLNMRSRETFTAGNRSIDSWVKSGVMSQKQMDDLIADISKNGIKSPLMIQSIRNTDVLANGHHRLIIAKMLGIKDIPVQRFAKGGMVKPSYFAGGGMVKPSYFVNGGFARGTDTVPAMLTPGEFIVNRDSARQFSPLLSAINNKGLDFASPMYPEMSRIPASGNIGTEVYANTSISESSTQVDNSVYNYNLSVNVEGTAASPDQIANVVMRKLQSVGSQKVRGQVVR